MSSDNDAARQAGREQVLAIVRERERHWTAIARVLQGTIEGATARACRDELHRILAECNAAPPATDATTTEG